MNVYLVTAGSYSDYHVVGAFSTEAGAQALAETMNLHDQFVGAEVEEYALDERAADLPGHYEVEIDSQGKAYDDSHATWVAGPPPTEAKYLRHPGWPKGMFQVRGFGQTIEHARRQAEELRRAILAGTFLVDEDKDTISEVFEG